MVRRQWAAWAAAGAVAGTLVATPAAAEGFRPVTDAREFASLVAGRALTRLGVSLKVLPDGRIQGRAFGRDVTGEWRWQGGFFCRVMRAGSTVVPDDCQAVLRRGDTLRFVAERGAGQYADLRLR